MTESPFDRWLEEAPFRHTGVFVLVLLAAVALFTGGCTPDVAHKCQQYARHEAVTYEHFNHQGYSEKTTIVTRTCVKEITTVVY